MNGAVKATATATFISLHLLLAVAEAVSTHSPTTAPTPTSTVSCHRFRKTGFWDIDIDNGPALPVDCVAPISAHALRDKSKLPIQIGGILASYAVCVLAVGVFLLAFGRRMRRAAETSPATLEIEMVNPKTHFEPASPASSQRSWKPFSLSRLKVGTSIHSKEGSTPASPAHHHSAGVDSLISFDTKVVQTDQEARQAEMERLYAAVMAHDEAKRASQAPTLRSAESVHGIEASPPKEGRRNLRVQISDITTQEPSRYSTDARSPTGSMPPKSPYKAIYPPYPSPGGLSVSVGYSPMSPTVPMTPMSPGRVELPNDMYPASPPPQPRPMQFPTLQSELPPTPRSFLQRQSRDAPSLHSTSTNSGRSKKLGLKNLRISGPVSRHGDGDTEDREPLSPHFIPEHPPAPPSPPEQRLARLEQPPTPQTAISVDSEYAAERLDQPKPLPMAQPQRRPSNLTLSLPTNPGANRSPSSSTNTLPFRTFQNASQADLPLASSNPLSPGPIKTTFLERKVDKMRGPMTGRTPRTGVPMTPYTPYMPFTPITPVTPGLMSRQARKERIKAEGRKVLVEEDVVKDADEMWDTGY